MDMSFEVVKLFVQLGIAGAILYVLWKLQAKGLGILEKIVHNHLTHLEQSVNEIKITIADLTVEIKNAISRYDNDDSA